MKTIKLLLLFGLIIVGTTITIQVASIFNNLKSEMNLVLTDAINTDLNRRVSSSDLGVRVGGNSSAPVHSKGIPISEANKKEFIPYNETIRRENLVFNDNIFHQTVLRKLNPIDASTLENIFHSAMEKKGYIAKTSIRYTDITSNKTHYSKPYLITISSSVIKLGVTNEMEVQAYIRPSIQWILNSISATLWFSIILFITLGSILLCYSVIYKRFKSRITLKILSDNNTYNEDIQEVDDIQTEPTVVEIQTYQDILVNTAPSDIIRTDTNQSSNEKVNINTPKAVPISSKKSIEKLENGNYQIGNFILDTTIKCLIFNGESIYIGRRKEYILLFSLLSAPNYYLTTKEVADKLGITNYKYNNRLNEVVSRLRTFLKPDPNLSVVYKDRNGYALQINDL